MLKLYFFITYSLTLFIFDVSLETKSSLLFPGLLVNYCYHFTAFYHTVIYT